MNIKSLLLIAASAATLQASAQGAGPWSTDTIRMDAGYANDVFYSMGTGTVKTESNTNWHIAFAGAGIPFTPAVIANHVQAGVKVASMNMQASTKFGTDLVGDTVGKIANQLYNDITTWESGAFNMNASGHPNYGWGHYDGVTHYLNGDSVYLVVLGNGAAYQLWIEQFVTFGPTMGWKFHVAEIDGSNKKDKDQLVAPTYNNKIFLYYDIVNDAFRDREPAVTDWDFMMTRYAEPSQGYYPVTGVLNNQKLNVAKLSEVLPDTTYYREYDMDTVNNSIGYDWKTFNMATFQYDVDTNTTYFVRSNNGGLYQFYWVYATGTSAGKFALRKRVIEFPTSVIEVAKKETSLNIYPNPAGTEANLILSNTTAAQAQLFVSDMAGRTVLRSTVNLKDGLNALKLNTSAYPAGMYIINVLSGANRMTQKLNVQH